MSVKLTHKPMKKYLFLLLSLLLLFFSCKPKNEFSWNAGWSAPKYYGASPFVEFLYQGEGLAGASANIGSDPGWGVTSGGYVGGDKYKAVPDSVYIRWLCGADGYYYEDGFKLPREKMLALFKKGIKKHDGTKIEYGTIVAGMAPGGNVTIWMQGGGGYKTEIARFKAENKGVWGGNDQKYQDFEKRMTSSKEYINSEANIFRNLHGIPYSVWEHGEKEYEYDIGFASEDESLKPSIVTFYSKDGSWFQPGYHEGAFAQIDRIDYNTFKYIPNNNIEKKHKLPVQIEISWYKNDKYYNSTIVLPTDFKKYFENDAFDRIVFSIPKNNDIGKVVVEGKQGRKDVMTFKIFVSGVNDYGTYISGGYSLPKGFVFPKWEGRVPLLFPEIEFWQEE